MIKKVMFRHYGQIYEFMCNMDHIEKLPKTSVTTPLISFLLDEILLEHVPSQLFNSQTVQKVSDIKSYLTRKTAKIYLKSLRARKLFTISRESFYYKLFLDLSSRIKSPKHKVLLHYLLIKHPSVLAVNIPIWSEKRKLVGHIDLLAVEDSRVLVFKYLKRQTFVQKIPNLLIYCDLLLENIPALKNRVQCGILNEHGFYSFIPNKEFLDVLNKYLTSPIVLSTL